MWLLGTPYPRIDLEVLSSSKLKVHSFKKGQGTKQILNHDYMSKDFLQSHCHALLLPKYANYPTFLFVDQTLLLLLAQLCRLNCSSFRWDFKQPSQNHQLKEHKNNFPNKAIYNFMHKNTLTNSLCALPQTLSRTYLSHPGLNLCPRPHIHLP